jgi:high-affinity iron transporter
MLATFIIGLREGVEAALIVGIIAAFLQRSGRGNALRWVWLGVLLAVALCVAGGVALRLLEQALPEAEQEGLETIVGVVAVGVVSYMVFWMRQHSRSMRSMLETEVGSALARGSVWALVGMAFFAVLREGFETAVFLLAVLQTSSSATAGAIGAVLGLGVATLVGYGIYKGGVRINLAKFFKVTGLVLVLVAAGLVASAVHSANEAGWLTILQSQALDLTWLIRPGTVVAALVTGMLGIRPTPTIAETIGWLVYLVPVGLFVLWPQRRQSQTVPHRAQTTHTPA